MTHVLGGVLYKHMNPVTALQSQTSILCLSSSSAGGRGTTQRFRGNWADINHQATSFFQMQIWQPSCLFLVFSWSLCQCCMYIITISVPYYSVLYYPVMSFLM